MMLATMLQAAVATMVAGQAFPVGVIAVGPGCPVEPTRTVVTTFREDLRAVANEVPVLSEEDSANPLGGRAEMTEHAIRELYLDARATVDSAQPDPDVVTRLDRAVMQVRRLPPSQTRCGLERDVTILRAKALWKAGKKLDAQAAISPLLMADKQLKINDASPPGFARFVEGIRASLTWSAVLMVTTNPPGKQIYVNGCAASMPLNVQAGNTYTLEADFDSRRGLVRYENVGEGVTELELGQRFEGSVNADAGPCLEIRNKDDTLAVASKLAARLGVRALVTISTREPLTATYFDATARKVVRRAELRPDGSKRALADFVLNGTENVTSVKALEGGLDATAARVRGARAAEKERWDEAEQWYVRALELEPDNAETRGALGSVVLQRGEPGRALPLLQEANRQNPKLAKVVFDLGIASKKQGQIPEAVAAFQRYVDLAPGDPEGQYELGHCEEELDRASAIKHYEEYVRRETRVAYEQRKKTVQATINRLKAEHETEQAIELFDKEQLKQHEQAQKKCQQALALDGTSTSAKECLNRIEKWKVARAAKDVAEGKRLVDRSRFVDAAALFERALKLDPRSVDARVEWGNMLLRQKKYREARDLFEEALEYEGTHKGARLGHDAADAELNAAKTRSLPVPVANGPPERSPPGEPPSAGNKPQEPLTSQATFSLHSGQAVGDSVLTFEGGIPWLIPGLNVNYRVGVAGYFDLGARISVNYLHELGIEAKAEALIRASLIRSHANNPWSLGIQSGIGIFGHHDGENGQDGRVVPISIQGGLHLYDRAVLSAEIDMPVYFDGSMAFRSVMPSAGVGIDLFVTKSFGLTVTGQMTAFGPRATAGMNFRL